MEANMNVFAGYEPRELKRAGSIATGALALAVFSFAAPAQAADYYDNGYRAPRVYEAPAYPPQPRYGEIYTPAHPPVYQEAPIEYRVLVYPQPRYAQPVPYPGPGYRAPVVHGEFIDPYGYRVVDASPRRFVRRPVYREEVQQPYGDLPYEPYGRAIDPAAPIPPGLVGPPRW
jgi:hypothetical protein